jgi:outer membrane protein OmpA-like peptidoglycan-associated protein
MNEEELIEKLLERSEMTRLREYRRSRRTISRMLILLSSSILVSAIALAYFVWSDTGTQIALFNRATSELGIQRDSPSEQIAALKSFLKSTAEMRERLTAVEVERNKLREQLAQTDSLAKRLATVEAERDKLREQLAQTDSLAKRLATVEAERDKLREQLAQGSDFAKRIAAVEAERDALKLDLCWKSEPPLQSFVCSIYFGFNDTDLSPHEELRLKKIATVIKSIEDPQIAIFGYTDKLGNDEYNKKLSLKRAKVIANALRKFGISILDSEIDGKGEANDRTAKNERNPNERRVDILVSKN